MQRARSARAGWVTDHLSSRASRRVAGLRAADGGDAPRGSLHPTCPAPESAVQGRLGTCPGPNREGWLPHASAGVTGVPVAARAPVSRRCPAGPGRGPRAGPCFQDGADGPRTVTAVPTPAPSSSASRAQQGRREQPDLGRPGGRVGADHQLAVVEGQPARVRGDLGADDRGPAAHHPADGGVGLPAALGHQPAEGRPEQLRVAVVRVRAAALLGDAPRAAPAGRRRRGLARAPAPGRCEPAPRASARRAGQRLAGRARGPAPGRRGRGPARSGGRSVIGPAAPLRPSRRPARRPAPRARRRHGRGDQHLLGTGDQLGEPLAPAVVELGEHVVEHQHRLAAGRRRAAGRRPPAAAPARTTRTRRGWRSPWRARPELEHQLVAVRTDQRDAAVELLALAHAPAAPSSSRGREHVPVGDAGRQLRRRATTGSRSPPRPRRRPATAS